MSTYFKFVGAGGDTLRGTDPRVVDTLEAFCHFTYEQTHQYALVVDLQGTLVDEGDGQVRQRKG